MDEVIWMTTRSLHSPARILKVLKALTGFSHIFGPDGFNNTLISQGCTLEIGLAVRTVGTMYISRTGEGVRSL